MRIYMQIPAHDQHAPRYYHLLLQPDLLGGWTLIREWGVQGAAGRVKKSYFETRERAEAALIDARDAQIGKGYRVVFVQGQEKPL